MTVKIFFIRKVKSWFIRFRLHRIVGPFESCLLNLASLSRVSKWAAANRKIPFNDFYSPEWDYNKRYKLYEYILKEKDLDKPITYLEFGVSGGHSFMWWLKNNQHPDSRFFGFDTFEGLPEDWGGFKRGAMSTNSSVPEIDDSRATFFKGLFQQTLPDFLPSLKKEQKKVIMMDADLYTSTLYTLTSIAPWLCKGDIIFFDQFNVPRHEFLAFQDFTSSYYLDFRLIGAANNYYFCAFELQ